jgi:hypothetical protein
MARVMAKGRSLADTDEKWLLATGIGAGPLSTLDESGVQPRSAAALPRPQAPSGASPECTTRQQLVRDCH